GICQEAYVSVIAFAHELDEVWSLIQGFRLEQGATGDSRELQELRRLLDVEIMNVERTFHDHLKARAATSLSGRTKGASLSSSAVAA
ncbi:unnamed protein product, partial [Discosporangium mesarthrocarpum]